jgi:CubicO group peptidase (beta-lactamase class C family)
LLSLGASTGALAQAAATVPAAPPAAASAAAAATFANPGGWSVRRPSPALTILDAPEGDLHIALVEVGAVADVAAASAAAWKAYRPAGEGKVELVTKRPARNGWDEIAVVSYETSPAEHVTRFSSVRRAGNRWTVLLVDGNQATAEKRGAAIGQVGQSLRPAGYAPESFAGKAAHQLDPARVAALTEFVRTGAAKLGIPGVGFALIDDGKIVFEGGVGVRELGKPEPIDRDTRFMIASNTKSMATLLLATLADEGKLRWDQPVTELYPAFRLGDAATTASVQVQHLVCACTGLPRKDFEWLFQGSAKTPAANTFTQLAATAPTSKFGEAFQYNNLMASAAGYVGAHLVYPKMELGAAFDRAMEERVFRPLGMNRTTFSMATALKGNYARPHGENIDGVVQPIGQGINMAIAPFRPAGGAWSTPHDMILYVRNELDEGLLPSGKRVTSAANLLKRRARGVPTGENQSYGMGLSEDSTWGVPVIHHGGDLSGYHSNMYMIPSAGVGAVILTNGENGAALRRSFMRRLLELLYDGKPEAADNVTSAAAQIKAQNAQMISKLTRPGDPAILSALAPAYRNADLGPLTISRNGKATRLAATAWSSDVVTRRNDDGSVSLVTVAPDFLGFDLLVGKDGAGKRTLTARDGQHVYVFTER